MKVCKGCGTKLMGIDEKGNPACPICIGINKDSGKIKNIKTPKYAYCIYCKAKQKNNGGLAFYNANTNTFYCGCFGWD